MRKLIAALVLVGASVLPMHVARAATPRFQIRCHPSHTAQVDPIVSPGRLSAHMHEFFGNTTTGSLSTYASMIAGETSCSALADTAGYWVPTLIGPDGVVQPRTILVYYRGEPGEVTRAFPPDLRVVSHDSQPGADLSNLIVKFPECWNGVALDSPDHISHMASAVGGSCPRSHPVRVPALTVVVRYPLSKLSGYTLSSGALSTMHADFWNTWDQAGLEALVARCLNTTTKSCPRIDGDGGALSASTSAALPSDPVAGTVSTVSPSMSATPVPTVDASMSPVPVPTVDASTSPSPAQTVAP